MEFFYEKPGPGMVQDGGGRWATGGGTQGGAVQGVLARWGGWGTGITDRGLLLWGRKEFRGPPGETGKAETDPERHQGCGLRGLREPLNAFAERKGQCGHRVASGLHWGATKKEGGRKEGSRQPWPCVVPEMGAEGPGAP